MDHASCAAAPPQRPRTQGKGHLTTNPASLDLIVSCAALPWVFSINVLLYGSVDNDALSPTFSSDVMSSFLLFLTINYLNLSVTTLQFFNCIELNGWHVMALAPDIPCDGPPESMHAKLLPYAALSLVAYPIGILLLFAYVIFSNRALLKNARLIRMSNEVSDCTGGQLSETLNDGNSQARIVGYSLSWFIFHHVGD